MHARTPALFGLTLMLAGAAMLPARADDWPQFRHDGRHTGISVDRLSLPLTDLWTLTAGETAVWQGRAFYVSTVGINAHVVCADMRTGATLWQAQLYDQPNWRPPVGLSHHVAVSESGVVFVSDWISHNEARITAGNGSVGFAFGPVANYYMHAYRAQDGQLIDESPNRRVGLGPLNPATLVDGPVTTFPDNTLLARNQLLGGRFLVTGEEVAWSTWGEGDYNRWSPGGAIEGSRLFHLLPLQDKPIIGLTAQDYVPTQTGLGILAGGQFEIPRIGLRSTVGIMQGSNFLWHWDFPWTFSTAAFDRGRVFLRANGDRTLFALEAGSGAPIWSFPPSGPIPDGAGSGSAMETITIPPANRGRSTTPQRPGTPRQPGVSGGSQPNFSGPFTLNYSWRTVSSGPGFIEEPRLVVKDGRVFWAHGAAVECLDAETGTPIWPIEQTRDTPLPGRIIDLIGAGRYILATTSRTERVDGRNQNHSELVALRQDSGAVVWRQVIPQAGTLSAADGLAFLSQGKLVAFAPAERTFRLAIDSDRPDDYDVNPPNRAVEDAPVLSEPAREPADGAGTTDGNGPAKPVKPAPKTTDGKPAAEVPDGGAAPSHALADATVLRFPADLPEAEMVRRARERRRVHPELPMLIALDWLDARRDQPVVGSRARWTDRDFSALQALCGRLVAEARPTHFDAAPDVNVYLARHPDQLAAVTRFLRGVRQEIAIKSPGTQLLASFNVEVLRGTYGHGDDQPFGRLALPSEEKRTAALGLWEHVDEVGLTTFPQAAFHMPADMPGDYLFALKPLVGDKHILITRIVTRLEKETPEALTRQASFLKHVIQSSYWLDASLIAYPEAVSVTKPDPKSTVPDFALLNPAGDRLSAAVWRDTLSWKWVQRLSALAAAGPR